MDKRRIQQHLEDYAKQEIPDDMNLWDNIKTELTLPGRARRSRSFSLVLALLLTFGAAVGVYAVFRQQIIGDPGVEGARDANLVTDLEESQTIDGVTLTLNWAYADANRIAIGYSIVAPEDNPSAFYNANISLTDAEDSFYGSGGGGGGGGTTDNMSREAQYTMTFGVAFKDNPPDTLHMRAEFLLEAPDPNPPTSDAPHLVPTSVVVKNVVGYGDLASEAVQMSNVGPDPANLEGWTFATPHGDLYTFPAFTLEPGADLTVYTRAGTDTATELFWGRDTAMWRRGELLTLATNEGMVIGIYEVGVPLNVNPDNIIGGGGGGGGGGGSLPPDATPEILPDFTPQPGIQNYGGIAMQHPVGPFVFEFDMPFIPAHALTPNQTVEANGVTMTLDTLSVSPSTTIAHLCYTLPTGKDWQPNVTLTSGEDTSMVNGWSVDGLPTLEDTSRCGTITFYAPYRLKPTTFTFTVNELKTSYLFTPEAAQVFKDRLGAKGIVVQILEANGEGFNYNLLSAPAGVDAGLEASSVWDEVFSEHYPGPWVFTVDIP